MKKLLTAAIVFGAFLSIGSSQNAEARAHFSFYFGGPAYVAPPYYVERPYYVDPYPYYYVAPAPRCYRVYEYTPFGPVYHTECY